MTLSTFISALAKRGASEARVSAGSEIQICVNNEWRSQTANLTDAALDDMIAKAIPLDAEAAWRAPNGRASFSAQNYNVEASKIAGAVTINLKRLAANASSGKPLSAQSAGELKNSSFANSNAFALVSDAPPAPPTAATPPTSWPTPTPIAPASPVPPPVPNVAPEWYYCTLEGVERGPFPLAQMRNFANMMTLTAQTLVWKEGMSQWLPVAQTELGQFLPQNHAPDSYNAPPSSPYSPPSFGNRTRNDSGLSGAILPDELRGFNSGAFFLPLFWCFAHGLAWMGVALFVGSFFIPGLAIGVGIALGFKGNEMAWQNRSWTSIEEFKTVQAAWARAGLYVFLAIMLISFMVAPFLPFGEPHWPQSLLGLD